MGERRHGVLKQQMRLTGRPILWFRLASRSTLAAFSLSSALLVLALQPAAAAAPSAQGTTLRLGLVLPDLTNQTINDIYLGAQAHAKELGNVEILEGGTSETGPWLNACERIVSSQVDVLAYDTLDAAGTATCIQQANDAGIKTICIFACVSTAHNDALVSLDFNNDGKLIGAWMAKTLGGSGSVGFLEGPPGDDAATAIGAGFKSQLQADCPGCMLVASVPGGHDRDTGYQVGLEVLTAHPDIKAMYGLNDDIAMGIVRAVDQVGKTGQIVVAGHNGTCEAMGAVLNGTLGFTVLLAGQPFGIATVDTAIKLQRGETVDQVNASAIPIDQPTAQGILDGSIPNPPGVDVQARLQLAQAGCNS
jgi:ribose transport system substrate-binding protein